MLGKGHGGLYNALTKEEERKKRKAKRRERNQIEFMDLGLPNIITCPGYGVEVHPGLLLCLMQTEGCRQRWKHSNLANSMSIVINVLKWRAPCKSAADEGLPSLIDVNRIKSNQLRPGHPVGGISLWSPCQNIYCNVLVNSLLSFLQSL